MLVFDVRDGALALLGQFGISNPLLAKALLINSADRGVSQWAPDSGWGYLNLRSAHTQALYGFADSVSDYQLYVGPAAGSLQSTITWNRHFDTNGQPQVNNLDLIAYDANTGARLGASTLLRGNVEFVDVRVPGNVVLKTKLVKPAAIGTMFCSTNGEMSLWAFARVSSGSGSAPTTVPNGCVASTCGWSVMMTS